MQIINDRLILLATAQECMADISDKMIKWENSQLSVEKDAFDALNVSDKVLKLSKEGSTLVEILLECCHSLMKNPSPEEKKKMAAVLEEIHTVFGNISDASSSISEISHKIEGETAVQKETADNLKKLLSYVSESIDFVVASAELAIAENQNNIQK